MQQESTCRLPNGTTKDENDKPEVTVALTELWMLHGFRPFAQIAETLRNVPELRSMMPDFAERLVRAGDANQDRGDLLHVLYCIVMTVPQERVDLLLNSLIATATPDFDSYCNFGHRVDVLWVRSNLTLQMR